MDTGKLIAHPSVRVRGSEHIFEPVECASEKCGVLPVPHLHCPLCNKNSVFRDARIVKAHYRVKHVDKGLYFAGLRMLRCSATCRISGSIKGEKKFRGPHWHCYKCRNGFCRRDEAMKHFETHFKLPQTTFQINIVQDVNEGMGLQSSLDSSSVEHSECQMSSASDISTDMDSNTAVAVTVDMTEEPPENSGSPNTAEEPTTVMIIQEEDTRSLPSGPGCVTKTREEDLSEKNLFLEKLLTEFRQQMDNLKAKYTRTENMLQLEIISLRRQLEKKNTELENLKRQQTELLSSKTPQLNCSLQKLLKALQNQHSELLRQHIAQARNEAFQSALNELQNGTTILAVDNSSTTFLQQESSSMVAMVLNSSGTLGIPVSLATNSSPSVVCPPAKTLLPKLGTTGVPVMISGQQAFVQPQSRTVQQAVGSSNLVLTLADSSEVSQDLMSSAQQGSTLTSSAQQGSTLTSSAQQVSTLTSSAQQGSTLMSSKQQGNTLMSSAQQGSTLMSTAQQGSTLMSTAQQGSTLMSTAQQGSTLTSTAQQGSTLMSTAQQGSTLMSTAQQGSTLMSTAQQGSTLMSTAQQGSTLTSTAQQGSTLMSSAQQGSTVVACTDHRCQLPSVSSDSKDEQEAPEKCTL